MIESKTISNKSEISYYRIFGWHKVGEYHGPSLMGTENLVSAEGKLMLRDKLVDEYYLQRDKSDSRYAKWVDNERVYNKYFALTKKTEVEAREVKQNKNRKALKATFASFLILAIIAFAFFLIANFVPQLMGQTVELFSEEWQQFAIVMLIPEAALLAAIIVCAVIVHKNRSRPLEKLLNYYRSRYLNAYKDSATSCGLEFEEEKMIEPLHFNSIQTQPTVR